MKAVKKLKVLLVVLLILLLSLISFGGIYYLSKGKMLNRVKDYQLSSDLNGYRQITLLASSSDNSDSEQNSTNTEETNISESENVTEENATSENNNETETNVNSTDENSDTEKSKYTTSDYKKAAEAIRGRLKSLKVENYDVALDNATGKITIKIPENDDTDSIVSDINVNGKFSIVDSDTNEELINNDDVKSVKVATYTSSYSSTETKYMQINFNNKGARKLKNITAKYQNTIKEENAVNETNSTSDNETTNEANETEATENETSENETTENETNETEANETTSNETSNDTTTQGSDRKVIIKIDDSDLLTTDFSEIIDNGSLVLTMGSTENSASLISERSLAAIIENEPLNVKYTIDGNTFVSSIIEDNTIKVIVYAEIIIALIISLYIVLKYRKNGIFGVILSIGYIAILLLVIRTTNVKISLNGILSVLIAFIINSINEIIILNKLNENKNELTKKQKSKFIKETFTKQIKIAIPILAIAIISLFSAWSEIFSLGMVLFWGLIISLIYNFLITEFLL